MALDIMKYITLSFILFFFFSCNKKEEVYQIDPEFRSYFASYKNGSWWFLEDSTNATYDSLYIQDYIEKRENQGRGSNVYFEIVEYKLYSKGKISNAYCGVENSGATCFGYNNIDFSISYFSEFPSICKDQVVEYPGCFECGFEIITNYSINSFSFPLVLKIWNQSDTFYYAKNVGLIQYTDDNLNFRIKEYDLIN